MFNRLLKAGEVLAYCGLVYASLRLACGHFDLHFSLVCTVLSGLWLTLTTLQINTLLRTYFDILSRLKVCVPLALGVLLALVSLTGSILHHSGTPLIVVTVAELCGWLALYCRYRRNKSHYIEEGHGPLPANAWVSPDAGALRAGDLLLTSGRVARDLHETVGHGELVVEVGGRLMCLSSYMESGTVLNPLEEVTRTNETNGEHFIALRLLTPFDETQKRAIPEIVAIMLNQTAQWRTEAIARRERNFKRFYVPQKWQDYINKKFAITGYDWWGLFTGHLASDHWTCVGSDLELLHRIGVRTNDYGTGLLGLGTGLFDPIMPVRFLADKHFRLLSTDDEKAYKASIDK